MQRKNDQWLEVAYPKFLDPLINYLCRFVTSSHAAEDVAHDAFLRVYNSKDFDNIQRPKDYLFRTARNIALDGKKRHCVSKTDRAVDVSDIADEYVSVEHQAMTAQEYATIRAAVDRLPERRQKVLILSAFFGYSGQEIANHLSISNATVHRDLARAMDAVNAAKSLMESSDARRCAQVIGLDEGRESST